jgi:hypothetical protein
MGSAHISINREHNRRLSSEDPEIPVNVTIEALDAGVDVVDVSAPPLVPVQPKRSHRAGVSYRQQSIRQPTRRAGHAHVVQGKCTKPTIGIWKTNAAESANSWNRCNRQRLHSALRHLTPEEFEHAIDARKRHGADASSGKPNRFTATLTGAAYR